MSREPGYCHHRASNQAYIRLGGRVHYLGTFGTEESRQRYRSLKAEWLVNKSAFEARNRAERSAKTWPTMADLCIAYLEHAAVYYGAQTDEYNLLRLACQPIRDLYANRSTDQFDTLAFQAARSWWLSDPKRSRGYVNKMAAYLRRILKWGVAERMVPYAVFEACKCVEPLKRGRTSARESKGVLPVPDAVVEATLVHCTPMVRDMICFQRLTGCRPGELVRITPAMVDRSGPVWKIVLTEHKNAYRGKARVIYTGPQAQRILAKYLLRGPDSICFSPMESERQRLATKHAARVTPLSCGNRPGTNRTRKPRRPPGEAFTVDSYRRSITRACIRGKIPSWAPNQLRHSAGTRVRAAFGLEASAAILGHSEIETTQIYAERDEQRAIEVAWKLG
jgi:integrase